VFKQEQAEYVREGIDWSYIEFVDNQDVLDLVEKRPGGVIDNLDEACRFPRATASDFVDKLCSSKIVSESPRFTRARRLPNGFTVEHYAGAVTYTADHFLGKNRDFVVAEHEQLVQGSGDAFVAALFPKSADAADGDENSSSNFLLPALPTASPRSPRGSRPSSRTSWRRWRRWSPTTSAA